MALKIHLPKSIKNWLCKNDHHKWVYNRTRDVSICRRCKKKMTLIYDESQEGLGMPFDRWIDYKKP